MIQSPHLPASFSQSVLCRWTIIAPKDYNEIDIYLWMHGGKKLTYDLTHCFSDHIAINQIIDGRKEKRAKFCGKNGFFRTKTFGREAEVRFWVSPSRNYNRRTRFRLLWFASKGKWRTHGKSSLCAMSIGTNAVSDLSLKWSGKGLEKVRICKGLGCRFKQGLGEKFDRASAHRVSVCVFP